MYSTYPGDRSWYRRPAILIAVAVAALGFAELQWHIAERAIGRYLIWHNAGRPKAGPQWERAENRLVAGARLETITGRIRENERALESIATVPELLDAAAGKTELILPRGHFERIYASIPPTLKPLVISADSLIQYAASGMLDKVLCRWEGSSHAFYFISGQNEQLLERTLGPDVLAMLAAHGQPHTLNVDSDARFSPRRTFELPRFIERLSRLGYERQQNFIQAMPAMTRYAGPATRVAISNKLLEGLVEVAVSVDDSRAWLYYLPEEWINDLVAALDPWDLRYDAQ